MFIPLKLGGLTAPLQEKIAELEKLKADLENDLKARKAMIIKTLNKNKRPGEDDENET